MIYTTSFFFHTYKLHHTIFEVIYNESNNITKTFSFTKGDITIFALIVFCEKSLGKFEKEISKRNI